MADLAHRHFVAEGFVEHFQVADKIRNFFQRIAQIRDSRRSVYNLPRKSATAESPSFTLFMDRVQLHGSRKWA